MFINFPATYKSIKSIYLILFIILFIIPQKKLYSQTYTPIGGKISGYTNGTFEVNDQGNATYSIPLITTPGTAGIHPNISLNYNSGGENSLIGQGWSLTGLSSITRAPQTIAQDGVIKAISFTNTDKFSLDGEKFVQINPLDIYGASGVEYRTEQNAFYSIKSYGSQSNSPQYFVVKTNSGAIMEYGNSADARIELQNSTIPNMWLLNKVSDLFGNYYTISYTENNNTGEYLPIRIDYTGNSNNGQVPYASLVFEYEVRNDSVSKFVNGYQIQNKNRLKSIKSYYGNLLVRSYNLTYNYSSAGVSQLVKVQECGSDGTCFEPTNFTWNDINSISFNLNSTLLNLCSSSCSKTFANADFNGDGVQDLFSIDNSNNTLNTIYVSNKSYDNLNLIATVKTPNTIANNPAFFGDFNGDGKIDVFSPSNNSTNNTLFLNKTNTNDATINFDEKNNVIQGINWTNYIPKVADLNGDGITDILAYNAQTGTQVYILFNINSSGVLSATNSSSSSLPNNLIISTTYEDYFVDFNGDGLVDVLFYEETTGNNTWYKNNGTNGTNLTFSLAGTNIISTSTINNSGGDCNLLLNDFNNDGLPDILHYVKSTGQSKWIYNKGNFTFNNSINNPSNLNSNISGGTNIFPMDFNNDGNMDIIWYDKNTGANRWLVNNGNLKFTKLTYNPINPNDLINNDILSFGNFTSTSTFDIILNRSSTNTIKILKGVNKSVNLIGKIVDGKSFTVDIDYQLLTNDSIYTKFTTGKYPILDYQASQFVVKRVLSDDGVGGKKNNSYKYAGGKVNVQGRGFRGFSEVQVTDDASGIKQMRYYLNDDDSWKYISSPLYKSLVVLPNGIVTSQTDNSNGLKIFYNGKSHFSYTRTSVSQNFEVDGSFVDKTFTNQEYDDYGNVVSQVIDFGNGNRDSLVNNYFNDPTNWIIGRLTDSKLYRYCPGCATSIKSSAFEYDNTTGVLVKEISNTESSQQDRVEKQYIRDVYGNITESRVTAWNGTSYITKITKTKYDNLGRFIIEETNPLGQKITKTSHPLFGHTTSETDPNGITTKYTYDVFGRKLSIIEHDGNWTTSDYRLCGFGLNCPPNAYHLIYTQSSDAPPEIKYYDNFNREIQEEKIGFNGLKIFKDVYYDSKGQVSKKSEPYYQSESPLFTYYGYDYVGRNTSIIYPNNSRDSMYYNGYTTVYVNGLGQKKTVIKNAKDQLVRVIDNNNKSITYTYDANNNLKTITDPKGNTISYQHDAHGNISSMIDPDMRTVNYVNNGFNELIQVSDSKGNITKNEYDILGRIKKVIQPEGVTFYTYDNQADGIGKLGTINSYNNYSLTINYDTLSRIVKEIQTISGSTYQQQYTYDSKGRIENIIYPSGLSIKQVYNANNYLYQLKNNQTNQVVWQANAINAEGQIQTQAFGNGTITSKIFDNQTNYIKQINVQKSSLVLQNQLFDFDAIGNLKFRKDALINKQENFTYDMLNRLTMSEIVNGDSLIMQYDDLGNILYKSDVGTYTYGNVNQGPHQVKSINLNNNQCFNSLLLDVTYNSFNKVSTITKDSVRIEVSYNPQMMRNVQKMYINDSLVRTKIYVNNYFDKEIKDGKTYNVNYIRSPEGVIAVYTTISNGQNTMQYLHRDHLGSIVMSTDINGAVIAKYSYDAWGKRRNADWTTLTDTNALANNRGFTGHEHYELFDIIDMNGRIYDCSLGRFLSADPFIQDPTNLQSLNRYSYVYNNPLSYTDPSGFFSLKKMFKKIGRAISKATNFLAKVVTAPYKISVDLAIKAAKWSKENWKTLVTIAVAIGVGSITGGTGGYAILSGALSGFASSATSTLLNGGNLGDALKAGLKGGAIGALSAAGSFGVGEAFSTAASGHATTLANFAPKAIAHGVVQGGITEMSGGEFIHGFISGAASTTTNLATSNVDNKVFRVAVSAAIGGTSSQLSGGKFTNGAMTGAYITMFNDYGKGMTTEDARDMINEYEQSQDKEWWGSYLIDRSKSTYQAYKNYLGKNFDKNIEIIKVNGNKVLEYFNRNFNPLYKELDNDLAKP